MTVKRIFLFLAVGIVVCLGILNLKPGKFTGGPTVDQSDIFQGVSYQPVDQISLEVNIFAENLFSPTRIKITPDGQHLLVSQINGEVLAFDKKGDGWNKKPYLVTKVDTKFPGFPPDEAGLTGMAFSQDFLNNKKLFLLYTFKEEGGTIQNRISVTTLRKVIGHLKGTKPQLIWQANTPGSGSHQIADAMPLDLNSEKRILFLIGEGFKAERSQNAQMHAGKVLSIKEDGSDTLVHALGIRNGYVMAKNPFDPKGRILISDTGPDKYDRLIYTNPTLPGQLNFGWDGNQDKLAEAIPDPNFKEVKDMTILRLRETKTFTGLAFTKDENLLATLFGQTGSPNNSPGKEIVRGKLTKLDGQPQILFETIIKRVEEAGGKLGNPIGLEINPQDGHFFFADVLEGRVYEVKSKGGDFE